MAAVFVALMVLVLLGGTALCVWALCVWVLGALHRGTRAFTPGSTGDA